MESDLIYLKRVLTIPLVLITLLVSSCDGISAKSVRRDIEKNLPFGSTVSQVVAFLDKRRFEHSVLTTHVVDQRYPGEQGLRLIAAGIRKQGWLFEKFVGVSFRFDEHDRLTDYKIEEALTGP